MTLEAILASECLVANVALVAAFAVSMHEIAMSVGYKKDHGYH